MTVGEVLSPGTRVEISEGIWKGWEGVIKTPDHINPGEVSLVEVNSVNVYFPNGWLKIQ